MVISLEFGASAPLYAKGLHPRLLMGPDEVDKLRAACGAGWCKLVLEQLRRKIAPMVEEIEATSDLAEMMKRGPERKSNARGAHIAACLDDIAIVGLVDKDERVLKAATRVITETVVHGSNNFNDCLAYDLLASRLTPEQRAKYIQHALTRIDFLIDRAGPVYMLGAGGNIPMTHTLEALAFTLLISNDETAPDMTERRDKLIRHYEAALYAAIGPQGYPAEDIGYGTLMVSRLLRIGSMLRRSGYFDAYTKCPRLLKFGNAMLHFVQPWGEFLSNTGDHGDDFGGRDLALAHLARLNQDPTLTWLLATLSYPCIEPERRDRTSNMRETELGPKMQSPTSAFALITYADAPAPAHPRERKTPTAFMDSDRGIASFRSGWRDNDLYAYFDGSQRPTTAQGHAHDSAGHFTLSAHNEYFAVSPGRYGIEQDQHNTLLVNGKSGQSTEGEWRNSWYQGRMIDYRPDALCHYAAADASQQANCYWSYRHFGLVNGGALSGYAWTVDDVNGANDFRSFWWTMYTAPGNTIELSEKSAKVIGARTGAMLDVSFAIPPADHYPKPHTLELAQDMPWTSSHKYVGREMAVSGAKNYVHHGTYNRPRLVAKVAGYCGRVMAVMIPREKNAPAPIVESIPCAIGSLAMRVVRGGFEDTIIFAYGHSLLEANGIRGRGRWLVVRRDDKRKVIAHTIHQGDWLEVDGAPLKV